MLRVLVVDDEIATCSLVARVLNHFGYTARFTDDGESAVQIIKAFAPHLIITDLSMPRMDGMALLHISKDGFPRVPVLGMTDGTTTREEIERLGFDGCILKPPTIAELLGEIETAWGKTCQAIRGVDDVDDTSLPEIKREHHAKLAKNAA